MITITVTQYHNHNNIMHPLVQLLIFMNIKILSRVNHEEVDAFVTPPKDIIGLKKSWTSEMRDRALSPPLTCRNHCPNFSYMYGTGGFTLNSNLNWKVVSTNDVFRPRHCYINIITNFFQCLDQLIAKVKDIYGYSEIC